MPESQKDKEFQCQIQINLYKFPNLSTLEIICAFHHFTFVVAPRSGIFSREGTLIGNMENRLPRADRKHAAENNNGNGATTTSSNNSEDEIISRRMTPNPINDGRNESVPMAGKSSDQLPEEDAEKSQPWWKKIWSKLALDPPTLLMMFKYSFMIDTLIYRRLTSI
jgi:hypothetical protein